jgi:hypothetical protein
MYFNTRGTNSEYGVTVDKIVEYSTTPTSCQCPASRFQTDDCKHIKSVTAQCSCPESVFYVHENEGLKNLCAEPHCETGALKRRALENSDWVKVLDGLLPRALCVVCEVELMELQPSLDYSLLYCYDGEHRKMQPCAECNAEMTALGPCTNPFCITATGLTTQTPQEAGMPLRVAV